MVTKVLKVPKFWVLVVGGHKGLRHLSKTILLKPNSISWNDKLVDLPPITFFTISFISLCNGFSLSHDEKEWTVLVSSGAGLKVNWSDSSKAGFFIPFSQGQFHILVYFMSHYFLIGIVYEPLTFIKSITF